MNYRDRVGNSFHEDSFQDKFLKKVYRSTCGRMLMRPLVVPAVSELGGKLLNTHLSSYFVPGFIRRNHIHMEDYETCAYNSYNDFFTRKIRPEARPVEMTSEALISPSDGKVSVYPVSSQGIITIKHSDYSVASLLRDKALAKDYEGGICFVIRLTVDNYHHYCYVDSGKKTCNRVIPGLYHTVNPVAFEHIKVFKENTRAYCGIHSPNFGNIIQMEVGAMMVGKIVNLHEEKMVTRGEEKGYFEFGGSTIVLLVKKDRVKVCEDIAKNMADGYETLVKMGEVIGWKA